MNDISNLVSELRARLGAEGVLTGAELSARTTGIWRSDTIVAQALFRPANTTELAAVLKACNAVGQTVVTHGGLTGLAEGAIATDRDVVLSTERLDRIERIDPINRILVAESGVRLQAAQAAAAEHGLMLALDLGARGSCTLGGNAATNAGGNNVIRYGMAREQLLGLEAVLADGTVVSSLNTMLKNNSGYDLKHLFIGSEGTLGVITRLVFRLQPAWRTQETALIGVQSFGQLCELFGQLDKTLGGTLTSFEVMWKSFYSLSCGDAPPLPPDFPFYVIVEALGSDPENDAERFLKVISQANEQGLLADVIVCKSGRERDAVWAIREGVEKTLEGGPAVIFDVSLPLSSMEGYVEDVFARLDADWADAYQTVVFGHAGDGNLHLVVAAGDGSEGDRRRIESSVYEPLIRVGGSVSAEHGIGLEKKSWLKLCRDPAEITLMRTLKMALDPQGILNPGRIFDLPGADQDRQQ